MLYRDVKGHGYLRHLRPAFFRRNSPGPENTRTSFRTLAVVAVVAILLACTEREVLGEADGSIRSLVASLVSAVMSVQRS
jgi:hypothetical protein